MGHELMKTILILFLITVNFYCNYERKNEIVITREYILLNNSIPKSLVISLVDSITWIERKPKYYKEKLSILYKCSDSVKRGDKIFLNQRNNCKWISIPVSRRYTVQFKDKEHLLFPFDLNKNEWYVLRVADTQSEVLFSWNGSEMETFDVERPTNF